MWSSQADCDSFSQDWCICYNLDRQLTPRFKYCEVSPKCPRKPPEPKLYQPPVLFVNQVSFPLVVSGRFTKRENMTGKRPWGLSRNQLNHADWFIGHHICQALPLPHSNHQIAVSSVTLMEPQGLHCSLLENFELGT